MPRPAQGDVMNSPFATFWESAQSMIDRFIARLPSFIVGVIVFLLFYVLSVVASRVMPRTTRKYRPNLGVVFSRLTGAATIPLGFLVAFSVVAPSFQAGDLIRILGISGVAIGFAFQNILGISLQACCCYGPSHFVSGMRSSWTTTNAR
jgi:small conductance mechanosensitive channel